MSDNIQYLSQILSPRKTEEYWKIERKNYIHKSKSIAIAIQYVRIVILYNNLRVC